MKPLKLHVENFIGIKRAEIEFEPGVYVLVGRNGSGKSSLFEAVHFALYGSPIRTNVYSSIRMGAREARVNFDFELGGKLYSISRKIDKSKSHIAFLKGDVIRPVNGASEVSKKIVDITGIDSKTFRRFFFIPQESITEVVEAGADLKSVILKLMKFEDMVKFMREALKFELEKLGFEKLKVDIENVESELKKIGEPNSLREHLISLDSSLEKLRSDLKSVESELKSVEINLSGLEEVNLEKLREEISRLEELVKLEEKIKKARELKPLLRNIRSLEEEISQKEKRMKNLKADISDLKSRLENLKGRIEKEKSKVEELEKEREELTERIEKLRSVHSKALPLIFELESRKREMSKLENERISAKKEIEKLSEEIEKLSSEIEKKRSKLSDLEAEMEKFRREEISWMAWKIAVQLGEGSKCPVCGGTIGKAPEEVRFDPEILEKLEKEIEKLKGEISDLETRKKILLDKKVELEDEVERIEEELKGLKEGIEKLKNDIENLGYSEGMEKELEDLEKRKKKLEKDLEKLSKDMAKLEKEETKIAERIESNMKSFESLEEEVERKKERLKNLRSEFERSLKDHGLSEEEVERLGDENIRGYSERLARLRERFESYKSRIRDLESKGLTLEKLREMRRDLESRKREILKEIEELSKVRGRIAERLERSKGLLKKLEELRSDFENVQSEKRIIESLIDAFKSGNFVNYVFSLVFEKIISVANSRFHAMTRGKFSLKLGKDGKFEVITSNGSLDPRQLSGGERTLLALSLITAVSDVLVGKVGLLFVDEGFAALDEFNRELVADVLRGFDVHDRVIIFITHAEDLKEKFERKLIMKEGVLEFG